MMNKDCIAYDDEQRLRMKASRHWEHTPRCRGDHPSVKGALSKVEARATVEEVTGQGAGKGQRGDRGSRGAGGKCNGGGESNPSANSASKRVSRSHGSSWAKSSCMLCLASRRQAFLGSESSP